MVGLVCCNIKMFGNPYSVFEQLFEYAPITLYICVGHIHFILVLQPLLTNVRFKNKLGFSKSQSFF